MSFFLGDLSTGLESSKTSLKEEGKECGEDLSHDVVAGYLGHTTRWKKYCGVE